MNDLRRVRAASALIAAAISLATSVLLLAVSVTLLADIDGLRLWFQFGGGGLALGVLIGPWLGWNFAAEISSHQVPLRAIVIRISKRAVVFGAVLTAAGLVAGGAVSSLLDGGLSSETTAALLLFGIPAFLMVVPVVAAWAYLIRRVASPAPPRSA